MYVLRLLAQLKDVMALEEQTKEGVETELPAKVLAQHAVVSLLYLVVVVGFGFGSLKGMRTPLCFQGADSNPIVLPPFLCS